jgi:hypothetical protein
MDFSGGNNSKKNRSRNTKPKMKSLSSGAKSNYKQVEKSATIVRGKLIRGRHSSPPFPISQLPTQIQNFLNINSPSGAGTRYRAGKNSGSQVEVCAHAHASMSKIFLFRVLTFEVNHLMYMGDKQKGETMTKEKQQETLTMM